jgi:ribosomal protein S18 acetylase RimI-like enzyme
MSATIRDYRRGDEEAAYHVCLKTGNRGADGEPLFRSDPDALGRIYVGPYLKFEPDLALILEDADGICGYALAAIDSRGFYDRYEREWRPSLCERFPEPTGDPGSWDRVESVHYVYHHPDYFCPEPYEFFPSHLHIDLLPRTHRKGFGRRMMQELMRRLHAKGSPGVHLCMDAKNDPAHAFYLSLGFSDLLRRGEGGEQTIYMGRRLNDVLSK